MGSFPKLGGCNALFLFEKGGELACILEFQAVSYLRYIQVASRKKFFSPQ